MAEATGFSTVPGWIGKRIAELEAEAQCLRERLVELGGNAPTRVTLRFVEDCLGNRKIFHRIPDDHCWIEYRMGHDGDPMSCVCVRLKRDNGKLVLRASGGQRLRVETDGENSIRIVPVDIMGERRGGSDG